MLIQYKILCRSDQKYRQIFENVPFSSEKRCDKSLKICYSILKKLLVRNFLLIFLVRFILQNTRKILTQHNYFWIIGSLADLQKVKIHKGGANRFKTRVGFSNFEFSRRRFAVRPTKNTLYIDNIFIMHKFTSSYSISQFGIENFYLRCM